MAGFQRNAAPDTVLIVTPELLRPEIDYPQDFPGPDGALREETDRYARALLYRKIALECFAEA